MLVDPRPRSLLPRVVRTGLLVPAAACTALAVLSLLLPSVPTYDPWAWIIWGREILTDELVTTAGPSWKPLPVLFTVPFAAFGDAAPELWLVVARIGVLGALVVAFRLGARLGGLAAGIGAAVMLGASAWHLRNGMLGNSEGLLLLFVLWAADRHLDGHRGHAFALGVAAGLLRPEAWPFLGLYALWLLWEDRRRLPWVAGGLALLPLLWLGPELWGSGNLWRAADRAQQPNPDSPAFAERPSLEVAWLWVKLTAPPALAGLVAALALGAAGRAPGRRGREALALAVLGGGWLVLVAAMTEGGYAGNERYLAAPAAIACVLGAAGLAWAAGEALLRAPAAGGRAAAGAIAAATVAGVAGWGAANLPGMARSVDFQAAVAHDLDRAVERAGGREAVLACGRPYTNPFLVQLVAWTLEVHGRDVGLEPENPATVLRAPHVQDRPALPPPGAVARLTGARTAARTEHWHVIFACAGGPRAAPAGG